MANHYFMDYSIKDINIYPIKGLSGISLSSAICEEKGLQYDRRYLIIDSEGKFLSQRELPKMTLFKVDMINDHLTIKSSNSKLELQYGLHSNQKIKSQIWSHEVEAYAVSIEADQWFSTHLGKDCRLVYMSNEVERKKSLMKSPNTTDLSFADGYPYLMIGTASLDLLNSKLEDPIEMERFRANIIINTFNPHEEDEWDHFSIGNSKFRVIKPCVRCQVISIDQQSGDSTKEPTKTLATYRKNKNSILFGVNTICRTPGDSINIGDKIIF